MESSAKSSRSVRLWAVGLVAAVGVLALLKVGLGSTPAPISAPASPVAASQSPSPTASACDSPGCNQPQPPADQLAEMRNALADKFGVVQVPSHSGKGDRVIELGLKAGIVKMTYTGNDAFRVDLLDSSGQPIGEPLVNRVGVSSSSAAFGLVTGGPRPVKIRVHGDARWSIVVLPMSAAPEIQFPSAHDGSGVFLYGGDASTWTLMNSDAGAFSVDVFGQDGSLKGRLVHTTGRYFKTVPAYPGPVLITVQSDGVWTIDGH